MQNRRVLGKVICPGSREQDVKMINEGEEKEMNAFDYVVERIDGDYAYLKRVDEPSDEEKMVARALLPQEIAEGTKLHYEFMMYTVID